MTSANVIEYNIHDKNGQLVGYHRQHLMCRTCNDGLEKFTPPEDFTMFPWGYDEEEEIWEDDPIALSDYLKTHKAEITFMENHPWGDKVKIAKR